MLGYPLVWLVLLSFQDYGLQALFTGIAQWNGVENYVAIFTDASFVPVFARTVAFTVALVVATLAIGLLLAELMMQIGKGLRTALGLVLILAWALPTVASTLLWQWLFQPLYGVVNWLLTQLRVFGDLTSHSWVQDQFQAFLLIGMLVVWQAVPFVALTIYAGRSQIPAEYYEAAMLDGASAWQRYRLVTLPVLAPVLQLVAILSIIWDFNVFNQIWILTSGGPDGGTTTLGVWAFQKAFSSNAFGQGAAIAVVTTVILMILTTFYMRRLVRSGDDL